MCITRYKDATCCIVEIFVRLALEITKFKTS